ncbi:hypothetical protein J5J83_03100 [Azoarcus sp. L1K30]|uniref:hypothetical protein n=1 Tax=Azoarcus sp. L1K30 TaxID=2820277 RepID=UPI001B813F13|nr:hypothetical protein [Azoarcus sp. L1K30]MBR0565103.1 hypothetical protein [Azoarcus sp. L1K30]
MSSTRRYILIGVVFSSGIAVGALSMFAASQRYAEHVAVSELGADLAVSLETLKYIRAGSHDRAAELLESVLDGHLVLVGSYENAADRQEIRRTLSAVRNYRSAFPRQRGNPAVRAEVSKVLAK